MLLCSVILNVIRLYIQLTRVAWNNGPWRWYHRPHIRQVKLFESDSVGRSHLIFDSFWFQLLPWGVECNSFKKHPSLWGTLLGNWQMIRYSVGLHQTNLKTEEQYFFLLIVLRVRWSPRTAFTLEKQARSSKWKPGWLSSKAYYVSKNRSLHNAQGCRLHIYK